jgi:hypothetical protein
MTDALRSLLADFPGVVIIDPSEDEDVCRRQVLDAIRPLVIARRYFELFVEMACSPTVH